MLGIYHDAHADKIHSVHHEESNVAKVTAEKADVIPTDRGPDRG